MPAPLRDILLRAAHAGLYQSFWSDEILGEVRRTLVTDNLANADAAGRLVATMRAAFPESLIRDYESLREHMTNDPKDRHVLAAAVKAQAQFIVTANRQDFPAEALEPFGIEAVSPDEFLTDLFTMSPGTMVEIVSQQAADLRNPP